MTTTLSIDILNYTNILTYFLDYYNLRKKADERFSYDIWAAELGVKSRSTLRLVCTGQRNITDTFIENYSLSLNFNVAQRKHFYLLAHASNQSLSPEIKNLLLDKVYESREIEHSFLDPQESTDFLTHPLAPTVQVLTGFKDLDTTSEKLADLLDAPEDQVLSALKVLQTAGLIELDSNSKNKWKSSIQPFKVKKSEANPALYEYYKNTLTEAQNHLLSPREDKHFRSVTMAIHPDQVEEAKQEMEDLIRKFKSKYASTEIENKSLYRINLNLYPLTKKA